eukprot:gnl/MRDRNA2_/MRDRNA2_58506_c0_seq1.p1 gnl/MRDRNA2_/MRDRNA2_58506_c0~~gnl/MRDRNA2_/MRDRNA2_58506_c0_seq1.p1  ORF type:complete len:1209 (+),score=220.48 gnl/MRDRNA2_/MRDRNA2_58506_c0_seq1:289-3627(+)
MSSPDRLAAMSSGSMAPSAAVPQYKAPAVTQPPRSQAPPVAQSTKAPAGYPSAQTTKAAPSAYEQALEMERARAAAAAQAPKAVSGLQSWLAPESSAANGGSMDPDIDQGTVDGACLKLRLNKKMDQGDVRVVACGELASLGSWNPSAAAPLMKVDGLWMLPNLPAGTKPGIMFKYVVLKPGCEPQWEGMENRKWGDLSADAPINVFNSMRNERPKKKKLPGAPAHSVDDFIARIAEENRDRVSYRLKVELPKTLLDDDEIATLSDLACLQAYLTWVASGQIQCKEDGTHNRPCAAAKAARDVTIALWELAKIGDAHRFIARRIFPSLPSFSDEFTATVPMTRIRDITHAWPHNPQVEHGGHKSVKLFLKHELQNKLHRCADPGDLVKLDQLLERMDRENGMGFPWEHIDKLKVFQVELRDFFNAAGLDDSARQIAREDGNLQSAVDRFLWLKNEPAHPFDQMLALTQLREMVAPRVEDEQNWLRTDAELDKYAFVLLSQIAGDVDRTGKGEPAWWERLVSAIGMALAQTRLTGLSPEECATVARELEAVVPIINDRSKAPLRVVASADRALRICFALQTSLEEAYAGVPALGKALNIDGNAISVFVEAELRASVVFQLSKLAQSAMQQAKVAAGLPLWTTISAGTAYGRLMFCASLSQSWSMQLPPEGAVIFCEEASGDEEVPSLVRGAVVARDLPVLSHLALRARQLGVVFACTPELALFEQLRSTMRPGNAVKLTVDAGGGARIDAVSDSEFAEKTRKVETNAPKDPTATPKLGALSLDGEGIVNAVSIADKPQVAGGKAQSCGKLEKICKSVGCLAPQGLAIPFGVMKKAVKGAKFDAALKDLSEALASKSPDIEAKAIAVRAAVESCAVPSAIIDGIMRGLPNAERVAVRSSANSEDLEKVSGAGLHDSVLGVDVKNKASLEKAVLQVWSSMFTLRAVQSRHAASMPLYDGIAMGVLVQPMVSRIGTRVYAFIAFSKDVVAQNNNAVYIEVCIGLGETLASANEPGTPYRLVVQKDSGQVRIQALASFSFGLFDMTGGPQQVRVDYSQERLSTDLAFLVKLGQDIASVAIGIERGYGLPMDMEGVVLEQDNGQREIHLVQARPIVER